MMAGSGLTCVVYASRMARSKSSPAISLRVIKHFAVITVIGTALIAMFADGEKRRAIEDTVRANSQHAAASQAEKQAGISKNVVVSTGKSQKNGAESGGWGAESFEQPPTTIISVPKGPMPGQGGFDPRSPNMLISAGAPPGSIDAIGPGVTNEQLAKMRFDPKLRSQFPKPTPAQRAAMNERVRRETSGAAAPQVED